MGHPREEHSYLYTRVDNGRTVWICRLCQKERTARWRAEDMTEEQHSAMKANSRNIQKRLLLERREKVVAHYGGKCECCGESELVFLALDHIDGGGNKHRREIGARSGSVAMYRWVINNDFPPMFRILCHNCNQAVSVLGVCPHQSKNEGDSIVSESAA